MASLVREKIVAAAEERFHAVGYNGCGVQEIVDAVTVPKCSFYNYFKSKELLALEVLANYAKGSHSATGRNSLRLPSAPASTPSRSPTS